MLMPKDLVFGNLEVTIYDFEFAGDILPTHTHTEENGGAHITICARGSVEVETDYGKQVLVEGNLVEFPLDQPHSIKALVDNSRIVNVRT